MFRCIKIYRSAFGFVRSSLKRSTSSICFLSILSTIHENRIGKVIPEPIAVSAPLGVQPSFHRRPVYLFYLLFIICLRKLQFLGFNSNLFFTIVSIILKINKALLFLLGSKTSVFLNMIHQVRFMWNLEQFHENATPTSLFFRLPIYCYLKSCNILKSYRFVRNKSVYEQGIILNST